jgi:hypothetical protein
MPVVLRLCYSMIMPHPSAPTPALSIPLIEGGLTVVAVALSFAFPRLGSRWFTRIERFFGQLARRKALAVVVVGISAFLLRLALLPWFPVPLPVLPDDFSFLLSGDTFAHARLTNPTPLMWVHFESIHISMQPSYTSMYFPGAGLVFAAGQVLFGQPWYGQLISNALMCAALCWMLQAWLPPTWALLGGVLSILRLALFSYWINTYTGGGALAALGGALVLGAFPRFMREGARVRQGLVMAVGMVLLAYTRPYEGMLLCVPVAVVLGRWLIVAKNRPSVSVVLRRIAVPVAVLIGGAAWLGFYDFRTYGNPLTLPYKINRATYALTPYFVWQPLRPEPAYNHEELRRFYHFDELNGYNDVHSRSGFVRVTLFKAIGAVLFYGGLILIPPLFMIRRLLLDRRTRFLVCGILVLGAGIAIEVYLAPHYIAPFTAAFYALGLQGMRHLWQWTPAGQNVGRAIVRLSVTACLIMAGLRPFDRRLGFAIQERPFIGWVAWWYGPDRFGIDRASIQRQLESLPGKQLAIVRYSPDHYPQDEWVYNSADIDGSKVIWAREMNAAKDRELFNYYSNRKVWLVQPDLPQNSVLSPYPLTGQMTEASR